MSFILYPMWQDDPKKKLMMDPPGCPPGTSLLVPSNFKRPKLSPSVTSVPSSKTHPISTTPLAPITSRKILTTNPPIQNDVLRCSTPPNS